MADLPLKSDPSLWSFEQEHPASERLCFEREYLCESPPLDVDEEPRLPRTYLEELKIIEMERQLLMLHPPIEVKASSYVPPGTVRAMVDGKVVGEIRNITTEPAKVPCSRTCQFHVSHPCEKCGRQWGSKWGPKRERKIMERKDAFWR